jgi:hypothetical protein
MIHSNCTTLYIETTQQSHTEILKRKREKKETGIADPDDSPRRFPEKIEKICLLKSRAVCPLNTNLCWEEK